MVGGATLTKLLGTSAWYAPGAAGAYVVESIIRDQKKVVPCCAYLEGEYGQQDICIGVPVVLGKNGVEKVLELNLNADEKALFEKERRGCPQDECDPERDKSFVNIFRFRQIRPAGSRPLFFKKVSVVWKKHLRNTAPDTPKT